jgi:adenylyltransferase/sulfurtransferase
LIDNTNIVLSKSEIKRYARHISLPELGIEGQLKLKNAKVLVIGCGGLGAPILQYLSAAGVGTIGLMDNDTVDESNLQRQVLFTQNDIGQPKVARAKQVLSAQNPNNNLIEHTCLISSENALNIINQYDVVVDGSDNFATRYLVNDACVLLNRPLVYGSINQFEGQVSVFNQQLSNGKRSPNYRDIFPSPPPPDKVPNCSEGGVLGVLPGIIGSMQANEVIKLITDIGNTLHSRMFHFDAKMFTSYTLKFESDKNNPLTGENPTQTSLIDYKSFCAVATQSVTILSIDPVKLKEWVSKGKDFELIDVREKIEYDECNLGGKLIPLGELENRLNEIDLAKTVVVHCRSGARSKKAIESILSLRGAENIYNLEGGILAFNAFNKV